METNEAKTTLELLIDRFWFAPSDILSRWAEALVWEKCQFKRPVLDIGCGDGRISELIFRGKVIDVGVDLDQAAVKKAAKAGVYQKVRLADATGLPFKKSSFRTVVSNSTFEHIKNDLKAVKEVYRVLKPDGGFYLTVPTDRLEKVFEKLSKSKEGLKEINSRLAHYHYRSLKEWQMILKQVGFKKVRHEYFFPEKMVRRWYRFFRLIIWKPYQRELWSYLSDKRFSKLIPQRLIKFGLKRCFQRLEKGLFSQEGCLLFIKARKWE